MKQRSGKNNNRHNYKNDYQIISIIHSFDSISQKKKSDGSKKKTEMESLGSLNERDSETSPEETSSLSEGIN
jgi:hypothetical protein